MGVRYRKTFKAGPIRVTASKSGISYSAGVKGARVTKRADGRVQTTLSAPGTGLSYTKSSGSTAKAKLSSSTKNSKATTSTQGTKPPVPTRAEFEQAWRASGEPLPAHGPRISERKAAFLAGLMASLARTDEQTRLFMTINKLSPLRDVLVLTSQRLLMFQANQVLQNSEIVAIELSSVREVTIRRRPWSGSLVLHVVHGDDRTVGGTVSTRSLAWLRKATKGDPMFVLPG